MMQIQNFEISEKLQGLRLDRALQFLLDGATRAHIQHLLDSGNITLNGKAAKKSAKVFCGDMISVTEVPPKEANILPENIPIDIVYEDEDLLVVNKPKSMVVHPAPGNYTGTLVNALMFHCGDRLSSINGVIRPGIVHRIDKDTSGLLLVAKNDSSHNHLAEQIKEHSLDRCYRAVVLGTFKDEAGVIDAPIGRNPNDRKKMAINRVNGKSAVTHYRVLASYGGYSYVECRLETGRTHQIRVHMASIGHPVLGDPLYFNGQIKIRLDFEGQCLHALRLGFVHPTTGERMVFESDLPHYFKMLLTKLESLC